MILTRKNISVQIMGMCSDIFAFTSACSARYQFVRLMADWACVVIKLADLKVGSCLSNVLPQILNYSSTNRKSKNCQESL